MSRKYIDNGINVICDICGKSENIDQPKGCHGTGEWISELMNRGWTCIMSSPVPFAGYDVCDECTKSTVDKEFSGPVKDFYKMIKTKNESGGCATILQDFLKQITSKYISEVEDEKKNNE